MQEDTERSVSRWETTGILLTIGLIGAVTAATGRIMGDIGSWGNFAVAAVFLVVGLHLLDAIRLPLPAAAQPGMKRKGILAAFIIAYGEQKKGARS
ncbi:MAG: hypothetical protein WCL44_08085 [bacterium]